MTCLGPLIFVLMIATKSVAAPISIFNPPEPCEHPKSALTVETHSSSAEILQPLKRPDPVKPLGCDRPFIYQGETYSADSPQAQDASNLKYFMRTVPTASTVLDDYQSNRQKSRMSAYTGTAGILIYVLSLQIARRLNKNDPDHLRKILQYSGAALAAGGFFYSFSLLRGNESLIPKAVDTYNQAQPKDPIEIRFSTGWSF